MQIRLNKYIAQSGAASRREADRLIESGRVMVNGRIVRTLGTTIDDLKDRVEVGGRAVRPLDQRIYLMLHKPPGYLVTRKDPHNRPNVMALLPPGLRAVFPVGRLDLDSEGLLLLTNDGELAHRLMHPRYGIIKHYRVKVKGRPAEASLSKLRQGINIDGKKTAPARIVLVSAGTHSSVLDVEIHEGRKREIRRMFESQGNPVQTLKRLRFAGLPLGKLKAGTWRHLRSDEVRKLKTQVGL
jgi:pseudouridine synthase